MKNIENAIEAAEIGLGKTLTDEQKGVVTVLMRMEMLNEYVKSPDTTIGCPLRADCEAYKKPELYKGKMLAAGFNQQCDAVTKRQIGENYCPVADCIGEGYKLLARMIEDVSKDIHNTISDTRKYVDGVIARVDKNLGKINKEAETPEKIPETSSEAEKNMDHLNRFLGQIMEHKNREF